MAICLRMSRKFAAAPDRSSALSFWLLAGFLAVLWAAGGASRADVLGQTVVRFSAWSTILVAIFALPRVRWREVKEPAIILGAVALLVFLQLVPLPSWIWTELAGRAIFAEATDLTGAAQPWRPISISPSGTANALGSLIVPAAVLLLATNLTREQHWKIAILVLGLVGAGTILGALQFSGADFDHPFINNPLGSVAGNFANRNHFALFLAIGCVLALAWAFHEKPAPWKAAVSTGFIVIFALMLLATGSRSGVAIGLAGVVLTFLAFRKSAAQYFDAIPRKIALPVVLAGSAVMIGAVWLSIGLDRAISVDRAAMLQGEADLRSRIWPIVLDMSRNYFPAGTGFGTFDEVFRITEPDWLLNPLYINQAHNDWLQTLLEGGIFGFVLLAAALCWFGLRSYQVWASSKGSGSSVLAKAGSINLILILAASFLDYPARTPMVMAILALACAWLVKSKREKPILGGD